MALLPLDDLLAVVREFINPEVSRAGLDRCLRRHGVGNLRELQAKALADAGETKPAPKTFKDYEPGFLHMDIKYLPQMPDESHRRYLFVAIDRATRWVFMHIYADQSEDSSVDFLNRLEQAAPMKIVKLLTDNGSQFTDRFTSKKREPSGQHKFDVRCGALNIEHRLCPPRHPQTNGMVERFNARISEVVNQTRFASAADLEATLNQYVKTYNHLIPQRALKHISPVQALKDWHAKNLNCSRSAFITSRDLTPSDSSTPYSGLGFAAALACAAHIFASAVSLLMLFPSQMAGTAGVLAVVIACVACGLILPGKLQQSNFRLAQFLSRIHVGYLALLDNKPPFQGPKWWPLRLLATCVAIIVIGAIAAFALAALDVVWSQGN